MSSSLRVLAISGVLVLESCTVPGVFTCDADSQCGDGGVCVAGGCAFEDEDCESGLRYAAFSTLAGECVEPEPIAEGSGTSSETGMDSGESSGTGSEDPDTQTGSEESGEESETGDTDMPDPPELLAHYTFDIQDVVGLVVLDSSGNELHALAQNVQPQPPGVVGDCFEFQELSRVEIPLEVVKGRESFTFECYVDLAPEASGVLDNLFYYGADEVPLAPPSLSLYFGLADDPVGVPRLFWADGVDELALVAETDFTLDPKWYHLAFSVSPEGMRLYVNHELEAEEPFVPELVNNNGLELLHIGGLPGPVSGFEGNIDELRFYDRALTPDEMMPLP